nr:hypothetical protein [Candidatus Gracilibacteria bacterium]
VSVLDTLRNALDSLINNPEVFVDGNANVREWKPTERRKVDINPGRVLDLHRDHEGFRSTSYGNKPERASISPVERLRRSMRRKTEKASRKKNR